MKMRLIIIKFLLIFTKSTTTTFTITVTIIMTIETSSLCPILTLRYNRWMKHHHHHHHLLIMSLKVNKKS